MIKNYLKIAFRNLIKQKLHSIINIAGLTIGMAISILILSYVRFELSFDRFHSKFDQIYRVVQTISGSEMVDNFGITGHGLASALKEEFPGIQTIFPQTRDKVKEKRLKIWINQSIPTLH